MGPLTVTAVDQLKQPQTFVVTMVVNGADAETVKVIAMSTTFESQLSSEVGATVEIILGPTLTVTVLPAPSPPPLPPPSPSPPPPSLPPPPLPEDGDKISDEEDNDDDDSLGSTGI